MIGPTVVGLDISQTATGVCDGQECWTIGQGGHFDDPWERRGQRMRETAYDVIRCVRMCRPHLVVVEEPTLGAGSRRAMQAGDWDRAGLWWEIVNRLQLDWPVAFAHAKKRAIYATGNGNADKPTVFAAAKRLWPHLRMRNHNEADAAVLSAMGSHQLGQPWPEDGGDVTLLGIPPERERGLVGVHWPVIVT